MAAAQQLSSLNYKVILRDVKEYFSRDNSHKILLDPTKALTYSIAAKIAGFVISYIFPFIGWGLFFSSIFLIDKTIIQRNQANPDDLRAFNAWNARQPWMILYREDAAE